mmetsp:Transcript_17418/g.34797  ORF Transcript_17418/g.34797 Transcript_17418/m.34797 type:complete len:217 (+) Transcript_17418:215-865(+)
MRRPEQPHELLEQELRELEEKCISGTDGEGNAVDCGESGELKKRVRSIKNCLAAKKSREQARSKVQDLEKKMSSLESQNQDLARRLALAEAENDAIKRGWKRPPQLCPEMLQQAYITENREGEPAALPTSLQLDAVFLLFCLVAFIHNGLKVGTEASRRTLSAAMCPLLDGVSDIPPSPRGTRHSHQSLYQAGQHRCIPHTLLRCIPHTRLRMLSS